MKIFLLYILSVCFFIVGSCSDNLFEFSWRSIIYPQNWQPGYTDSYGRFLHDFSYAGYYAGEKDIPFVQTPVVDVTKHPYNADNTGVEDVTTILQQALDDIGEGGGGVVYLPEGIYHISVENDARSALDIRYSNTILRGAGTNLTRIVNTTTFMRSKSIIRVDSGMRWTSGERNITGITKDLQKPTKKIPVENVGEFSIGDMVVLRSDVTEDFIQGHNMESLWNSSRIIGGVIFYRRVLNIDYTNDVIFIDAPTRYFLKTRDNARVYRVSDPIEGVGLEYFSIGNLENKNVGFDNMDYSVRGTGAYEVHASHAILLAGSINSWIRDVSTFRPENNKNDIHLLSNGISVTHSRHITVQNCSFKNSQFNGAGGNGYLYKIQANDCLFKYNIAENGRRNFSFLMMFSNGNVLYRCTGKDSQWSTDFHMHLSMANLLDNFNVDGDFIQAINRGNFFGHSTTQSVFWNTNGIRYHNRRNSIIYSQQFGWGYIIGTRGIVPDIEVWGGDGTEPIDFVEGIGDGNRLEPQSLYKDQLRLRMQRGEYTY